MAEQEILSSRERFQTVSDSPFERARRHKTLDRPNIDLKHIGKSADNLRFFILCGKAHAGGITVHSVCGGTFSYGIAIAREKRRRGIARAALPLFYEAMRARGFTRVQVQIAPDNAASLALHRSLGFIETARDGHAVTLERAL